MYSQNVILNLWKQLAILTSTEELFPYNYTCLAYLNQLLLLAQTISCIYPWARALPVGEKSLKLTTAGWRNQPHLTTQPDWPQMPIQLKASSLMFVHFLPRWLLSGGRGRRHKWNFHLQRLPITLCRRWFPSTFPVSFFGRNKKTAANCWI